MTNKMNNQESACNTHNRSMISVRETDNCDYVISGNFDVKDYFSDILNVDCCDTYLTGNIYNIYSAIYRNMKHNFAGFVFASNI